MVESPSNIGSFQMIGWVTGVLRRKVVGDSRLDNLRGSHLQSQVIEEFVETSVANNNFLRAPVTKMIFFNQGMLLVDSNHFLISSLTTMVSQSKLKYQNADGYIKIFLISVSGRFVFYSLICSICKVKKSIK